MALNAASGAPSYLYEITHGFNPALGATHSIDSAYLFGNFDVFNFTPGFIELEIRDSMRSAWSSLAHDPRMAPVIVEEMGVTQTWPVYEPATAAYAHFGVPVYSGVGHRGARCAAVRAVFN